jgi:hypothetical protein
LKHLRLILPLVLLSIATTLSAQVYNLRGTDLAFSGAGQFTSSITNQNAGLPHQSTTGSLGFLLTFRDHPITKLDVELNYQYSSFTERFIAPNNSFDVRVPLAFHEATAAYVIRNHVSDATPFRPRYFVGIGGGALYFNPSIVDVRTQLRATGLVDVGVDIPTRNPHITYRLQGRSLFYRAPNFNQPILSSSRWYAMVEPAVGVAFHY